MLDCEKKHFPIIDMIWISLAVLIIGILIGSMI